MCGIFKLEMEAWEEGEVPGMKKCAQDSVYQAGVKFQGKCGHAWGMCRRERGCRVDTKLMEPQGLLTG